ncbi:phage N-6-adenine-methyltransferase, partial [Nocardioides massiliensis]
PPYSDIAPWIRKAWECWASTLGIVMLLPANRTEQQWWQQLVEPYRDRPRSPLTVEFLPGRMRFLKPGQTAVGPNNRPPFGCCLLVWQPPLTYRADRVVGGLFDTPEES